VENRDDFLGLVVDELCDVKESPSRLSACLAQAAKHGLVWNDLVSFLTLGGRAFDSVLRKDSNRK
jgi:hypothetical protein